MGSFKDLKSFTAVFADYMDRVAIERFVALRVTMQAGDAHIRMALATADRKQFFIYEFVHDFSQDLPKDVKKLCELTVESIDEKLVKNATLIDIESDEGMEIILRMFEEQLPEFVPYERKGHWAAVYETLSVWSKGGGLKNMKNKDEFKKRAASLLQYVQPKR